jgi:predicted 3-demethylubiquinone-9 3-methyltransferase (glyoxalase superfamily)
MQKITPFLWFDGNAEEAMNFYTTVFKDSKIGETSRYNKEAAEATGRPEGSMMVGTFQIEGQEFMVLNGGPVFKFNESVSFMIHCEDQAEVDYYWDKLTDGGQESQCGWLKDKFDLSWQVVPNDMGKYIGHPDPVKAGKAMQAMIQMKKLDISKFEEAINS